MIPAVQQALVDTMINITNQTLTQSASPSASQQPTDNQDGFSPSGNEIMIGVFGAAITICAFCVYIGRKINDHSDEKTTKSPLLNKGKNNRVNDSSNVVDLESQGNISENNNVMHHNSSFLSKLFCCKNN